MAAVLALGVGVGGTATAEQARYIFGAKRDAVGQPAPIGSYAAGCLAGGQALAETGPGWQAMRLSRNRNWGHPAMLAYIERLSVAVREIGWPRLYVGDISQPRGGPMLSGHSSHQIGLDADFWMRKPSARVLTKAEREQIGSYTVVAAGGRRVNGNWTEEHHAVVRAAALDPEVARIFVNPAIKGALCEGEPATADRGWLRKIRPWFGHDAHFHVRLSCPPGARACVDQAPPPPGDGCGAELASWFQPPDPNAKPTPRRGPPRGRLITLAQMPQQCRTLVE
ncbi:MAG: penicillin-insensitive murein endopeptidase [Pseudomonadota bacterium]